MALQLVEALNAATEVALQAGALIRAEFHRAGGPRGRGSHAAVDDEAERLIRDRLRSAFPDWAYLGEETGRDGPAEAHFRWLVDPNDGTRSYLEGRRGSAVSIALVREGVPVLGVVYAPLAPDDSGDLIAWAEGLPLTRNGQALERRVLPDTLGPEQVVLVSQDADQNPEANAQCVAPARYGALPSIAYRLALVAAGEAEAAVSLNGPVSWDFAGGHALLRAVGGTLLDVAGRPIEYDRSGGAAASRVFGGSAGVARVLAGRDWGAVFEPSALDSLSELFPPPPMKGRHVADAGQLSRAQGCLLGQVAGDALGGQVEFSTAAEIRKAYPDGLRELRDGGYWDTLAGQPTDDSELALILARTLVRDAALSTDSLVEAYRGWLASGPFDVGGTTSAGLHGNHNHESQANGSLMRASPLGIFGHALPAERLGELARLESAITHPHTVCRDACAAFVLAIAHAVRTGEGAEAAHRTALAWTKAARADSEVLRALERSPKYPPESYSRQMGWVLIAFQNAFHQALTASSVEEGVVRTVMQGGDTDTNGAIAGALLGAVYGRRGIPPRWRRAVLSCRAVSCTPHPRPRCLWPVDVEEVGEGLLAAGLEAVAAGR